HPAPRYPLFPYTTLFRSSAFLTEVARDEILRRQQRNAMRAARGAWKDEDHPELKDGAEAWVSRIRSESEKRFEEIERHRDPGITDRKSTRLNSSHVAISY